MDICPAGERLSPGRGSVGWAGEESRAKDGMAGLRTGPCSAVIPPPRLSGPHPRGEKRESHTWALQSSEKRIEVSLQL